MKCLACAPIYTQNSTVLILFAQISFTKKISYSQSSVKSTRRIFKGKLRYSYVQFVNYVKFEAKPIIEATTEDNNICTKPHSAGFETISIWKATSDQ